MGAADRLGQAWCGTRILSQFAKAARVKRKTPAVAGVVF
jgi:hypothetical protein